MTYLVMANEHVLARTEDLDDAKRRMEHFKCVMNGFGLGNEGSFWIGEVKE